MNRVQYLDDVEYIIIKPRDIIFSSENIGRFLEREENAGGNLFCDIGVVISNKLTQIGIPVRLKGYRYIITAVKAVIRNEDALDGITKILYPLIAKRHHSTPQRVEKAIRHAIEVAWKEDEECDFKKAIQNLTGKNRQRPTNSEFIAFLSQEIKAEIQ